MPVPADILAVERPVNSIVVVYGKNKNLYAVRKRVGCDYVGGRRLPKTGPTIGHIIDHKYVPIDANTLLDVSKDEIDLKDWGSVILCDNLFKDIRNELLAVYNEHDADIIYCISILRVCNPGITDCELKEAFDTSFLSELYPKVALSKNSVSTFLNDVGKRTLRIKAFMKKRAAKVKVDHHLLVDGTLKTDDSKINSFSDFSRKARKKGTRDISVIFAFDLEEMEPVCSKCFPGNMLDAVAYESFIIENGITQGIIVADKGFPESSAEKQFELNPNLHYINPIKRNLKVIEEYNLTERDNLLDGFEDVTYCMAKSRADDKYDENNLYRSDKEENKKEKYYYSYWDGDAAGTEQHAWIQKAKKEKTYSSAALKEAQKDFGTIVLESDLKLDPKVVYMAYLKRWEIELVMRFYKSACQFDETRVHDDYSVIASEFCDFLATLLTFRLLKRFDELQLLNKMTYKKLMKILIRAKKQKDDDGKWKLVKPLEYHRQVLEALGLIEPKSDLDRPKRKPGRKKAKV